MLTPEGHGRRESSTSVNSSHLLTQVVSLLDSRTQGSLEKCFQLRRGVDGQWVERDGAGVAVIQLDGGKITDHGVTRTDTLAWRSASSSRHRIASFPPFSRNGWLAVLRLRKGRNSAVRACRCKILPSICASNFVLPCAFKTKLRLKLPLRPLVTQGAGVGESRKGPKFERTSSKTRIAPDVCCLHHVLKSCGAV